MDLRELIQYTAHYSTLQYTTVLVYGRSRRERRRILRVVIVIVAAGYLLFANMPLLVDDVMTILFTPTERITFINY